MHGLARIVNSKNYFIVILRLLIFLASLAFCVWTIYRTVHDYLKFTTVTESQSISLEETDFPAVYVCAMNERHLGTLNFTVAGECSNINGRTPKLHFETISFTNKFKNFKCYRINSYKAKFYSLEAQNCLRLRIFNGKNSFFFVSNRYENYIDNKFSRGSNKMKLEIGFHHDFRISKTEIIKLSEPYSNCSNSIENYQINNCLMDCYTEKIAEKYNCTIEGYSQLVNYTICPRQIDKKQEARPQCLETCPLECKITKYFLTLSKFPVDREPIETSVHVAFSSIDYVRVTDIPKTSPEGLISNVGGTLGLFLGMSFLSFVEIVEFIIQVLHQCLSSN